MPPNPRANQSRQIHARPRCHAFLPAGITASWSGTYEVIDKTLVSAPASPSGVTMAKEAAGQRTALSNLVESNRIDARVGYGFGVIYKVPEALQKHLKAVVLVPPPGIPDRRNGQFIISSEWPPNCSEGKCRALYNFEDGSELVPGVWRIELWRDGGRLRSHEFILSR